MIYTTTTSILLLSTVANTVSIAAAVGDQQQYQNRRQSKLPQHRIISTKRVVPYPVNHPLGRHLREDYDDILDDEYYSSGGNNIVGGDGSRYRQQQIREQQTPINNRFLRFFSAPSSTKLNRKRRRDTSNSRIESTSIQQGTYMEPSTKNDQDTTIIQYYTITGTTLSNSATQTHLDHITKADQTKYNDEDYKDGIPYKVLQPHKWRASYAEEKNEDGNDENLEDLLLNNDKEPSLYPPLPTDDMQEIPIQADSLHQTDKQSSIYQPIRIRAILTTDKSSGAQYLTNIQRQILLEDIINPALFSWSSALHIIPVGGDRGRRRATDDTEEGVNEDVNAEGKNEDESQHSNLIIDRSQLYDSQSCGPGLDSGLPSVKIPNEHMTIGIEDTDTVIYVSISFTNEQESTVVKEPPTVRGEYEGSWESLEQEEEFGTLYHLHNGVTGPEYRGRTRRRGGDNETISSSDEFENNNTEYPSMSPSYSPSSPPSESEPLIESRPTCTGSYLATSTYCNTDQYDRPIAGMLHICIPSNNVNNFFHDANHIKRNIVTVQHELGHILGMNIDSLGKFRNPDTGLPLTERDEEGNVPITEGVECTGTVSTSSPASNLLASLGSNSVQPRLQANIPIPSTDILKFTTVRGGVRVATIVTPTVQRIVRNMFNCRTLKGAELESGVSQLFGITDVDDSSAGNITLSAGECIGDHWSRRLFRTDLMNSIVDEVLYTLHISSLTLAYMVDTGWYKVNTNRIASPSIWGRNAGCNFVNKKCLTGRGQVTASNNPFFCNNFLEQVVEPVEDEKENPKKLDYYKKEEEVEEEEEAQIHGCSLDSSRKATCSLVEYDSTIIPDEYNYFQGDKNLDHTYSYGGSDPTLDYCPVFEGYVNGKCTDEESQELMEVSDSLEVFGEDNSRCVMGHVDRKRTALCLPIACAIQEQSLLVKVDGYWKPCSYAGQVISVWWNPNDYVVCPDPSRMCPTFFCPNDCFGEGGNCDYQTGQCMCEAASSVNSTFSPFYTYQRFVPCSPPTLEEHISHHHLDGISFNGTHHAVERVDFELPEYYVLNKTMLVDDPRKFDDKVSRMFAQLSAGEVFGLVASFMFCAIFLYIVWSQLLKCHKRRVLLTSLSRARSSVSGTSLSGLLRITSTASLNTIDENGENGGDNMDSPPRRNRGDNPQKGKMVASLLVQMRTQEEQQRRLELGGLTGTSSNDESELKRKGTIADLPPSSEVTLVNRSELPPLPDGGRVLAVVGAHIVEDEGNRHGSVTSATHTSRSLEMSEFQSPLFHDESGGNSLRMRRHME